MAGKSAWDEQFRREAALLCGGAGGHYLVVPSNYMEHIVGVCAPEASPHMPLSAFQATPQAPTPRRAISRPRE